MTCLLVEELRYLSCGRTLRLKKADLHSQRNRQLAHAVERLFRLVGLQQIDEGRSGKGEANENDAGVRDDELGPKAARDCRRPLPGHYPVRFVEGASILGGPPRPWSPRPTRTSRVCRV